MKKIFLCFFLYLAWTIILTLPLALNLKHSLPGPTIPGDQLFVIWLYSWEKHALFNKTENFGDANIFYPAKNTLFYSDYQPANFLLTLPLLKIFKDPILVYNLIFFAAFFLSGFSMYLLVLYFTKNHFASFVSGFVFAFSPFRFVEFRPQLLFIAYLPLAILFLDRYLKAYKIRDLILFAIFFVLQFLVSWYLAFYLMFIVGIYILGFYLIKRQSFNLFGFLKLVLAFSVAFLIIFPFYSPYLEVKKEIGLKRPIWLIQESAPTLGDFFSVNTFNKFYKFLTNRGLFTFMMKQTDWQKQLFFGFTTMFLGIVGLFNKQKKKWIFLVIVLFGIIVSLGPYYHYEGKYIKMPYYYFYHLIPGFSGLNFPGRLTNITIFGIAILAGYGLLLIMGRLKKNWLKMVVLGIISLMLISESFYVPISTAKVKAKKEFAPVYFWLAKQPEDFAIIEFPFWNNFESERMYYSTLHWKKLYNGFSSFFPPETLRLVEVFRKFPAPEVLQEIKNSDAKYFIVHLDEYPEGTKEYLDKHLPPWRVFGSDYLYSVEKLSI